MATTCAVQTTRFVYVGGFPFTYGATVTGDVWDANKVTHTTTRPWNYGYMTLCTYSYGQTFGPNVVL